MTFIFSKRGTFTLSVLFAVSIFLFVGRGHQTINFQNATGWLSNSIRYLVVVATIYKTYLHVNSVMFPVSIFSDWDLASFHR